jgi:hypothetical protein
MAPASQAKTSDHSGKRKRVEVVDLTADDGNDARQLDTPVR